MDDRPATLKTLYYPCNAILQSLRSSRRFSPAKLPLPFYPRKSVLLSVLISGKVLIWLRLWRAAFQGLLLKIVASRERLSGLALQRTRSRKIRKNGFARRHPEESSASSVFSGFWF
jgi:type IV secretory pathway TrbD component